MHFPPLVIFYDWLPNTSRISGVETRMYVCLVSTYVRRINNTFEVSVGLWYFYLPHVRTSILRTWHLEGPLASSRFHPKLPTYVRYLRTDLQNV